MKTTIIIKLNESVFDFEKTSVNLFKTLVLNRTKKKQDNPFFQEIDNPKDSEECLTCD